MNADRDRPHPNSPVQPGRRSRLPLIVVTLVGLFMVWDLRDTWVDTLASPVPAKAVAERQSGREQESQPARGNLAGLFSGDDYPIDALRMEQQGRTTVRLRINAKGKVSNCSVVASSGSASLDRKTCAILSRRARFTPARDSSGNAVEDSFTQTIVWQLQ